jgi:hypothetical protein
LSISSSNAKAVKIPLTVTEPAGNTSATFTVQGDSVTTETTVTVTATYKGSLAPKSSSASASLTVSPSDSIKIISAPYSKSTSILQVNATSTNPHAILTLFNSSKNQSLGTMVNQAGTYSIQLKIAPSPSSITVKSNLGGQNSQGVKQN